MIKYASHPETASYTWDYTEGCFEGGAIAHYSPARKGEIYTFNDIPIEVHQVFNQEQQKGSTFGYGIAWIFRLLGTLSLLVGLVVGGFIAYIMYEQIKGP